MVELIDLSVRVIEEDKPLPEGIGALELLRMVYRGKVKVSPQQMRAAIEALPFEQPKLSSVAMGHFSKEDFASLLDRAISRSAKVIEGKVIQIEGQMGIEEEPKY